MWRREEKGEERSRTLLALSRLPLLLAKLTPTSRKRQLGLRQNLGWLRQKWLSPTLPQPNQEPHRRPVGTLTCCWTPSWRGWKSAIARAAAPAASRREDQSPSPSPPAPVHPSASLSKSGHRGDPRPPPPPPRRRGHSRGASGRASSHRRPLLPLSPLLFPSFKLKLLLVRGGGGGRVRRRGLPLGNRRGGWRRGWRRGRGSRG
mmetsp:Transcript_26866/g.73444  ORF Transcript_26866/g.73444 Transcript_26866/m.73444 type:complete len:204 (-) Transcript_26866:321-932(-)